MNIMTRRIVTTATALLLTASLLAGCGGKAANSPAGGAATTATTAGSHRFPLLRVAIIGEPPTLDVHTTTTTLAFEVGWHIFETLYTYTPDYGIQPMLAEKMPDITDGGKVYTINLRQGVPFHNGKEMTADDVVASINRWNKLASSAKGALTGLKSVTAKDKYTVELAFDKPNGALTVALATPGNGLAIYPKEICEKYPDKPIEEFIGTGPYKLVEHVTDRYFKLQRFDKYAARTEPQSGPGGKKEAYADEIRFIPVADPNTRLAGLQSGEYDAAALLSGSQLGDVKSDSSLQAIIVKPISYTVAIFNTKTGPFTNKLVRQAAQAVLDSEPVMQAAFGSKELYRIDPGLMQQEQGVWYTDAGKELYSPHNIQKAKDLLAQAGYKGEKIRYLVTKEYDYMYKSGVVYADQLKAAGFNVELVVSDWATLVQNRAKPDGWEIYTTGISLKSNPLMLASMGDNYPGWWKSPMKDQLESKIASQLDDKQAAPTWSELQKLWYTEAPGVKFGDYFSLRAARKNVQNMPTMGEYYFWNTYIEKK